MQLYGIMNHTAEGIMTEERLDIEAWLLTMVIGTPIILVLCWLGVLPLGG
jgi:hypothetical protein